MHLQVKKPNLNLFTHVPANLSNRFFLSLPERIKLLTLSQAAIFLTLRGEKKTIDHILSSGDIADHFIEIWLFSVIQD